MTDLLTDREGVNVQTSQVKEVVTLPRMGTLDSNIRRFGFEYEMLPRSYRDGDGDYDGGCGCNECRCDGGFDGGRVPDLIGRAHQAGAIASTELHDYHCRCSTCSYDRDEWLLVAQTDCSVGVEFVSRILDLQREDWPTVVGQINNFISMMHGWKHDGHWMPDGEYGAGNHVHVSSQGDTTSFYPGVIDTAAEHIDAIYAAFNWDSVADGGTGQVRSYNEKPDVVYGGYGGWLSKRTRTFEHRLWNTPYNPDLLWGHMGLSIAIQRWAFSIATQKPLFNFWDRPPTRDRWGDSSGKRMTDARFNEVNNHLGEIIRGIRSYVPARPEFAVAGELIGNLRSM